MNQHFAEQKVKLKEVCLNLRRQTEISSHIYYKQSLKDSLIKRLIDRLIPMDDQKSINYFNHPSRT